MADLVAFLSTGKGSWGHVSGLIKNENWNNIFLLTNDFGKEKYSPNEKTKLIVCDLNAEPDVLSKDFQSKLKGKISGEVGVNFVSGSGKEHMALISALINLGVGFRLVVSEQDKVKEI